MENPREHRLRVAIRIKPTKSSRPGADACSAPAHIECTSTSVTVTASNTHHAQQQQTVTLGTPRDPVMSFGPGHSNDKVASLIDISSIVHDCVLGKRDGLVCCYGQSCSGKSYTMFGPGGGLVQQGLQTALTLANGCDGATGRFHIQVSAYELYGNTVRSLIDLRHGKWMHVTKTEDIRTVHEMVATARTVSSTNLNAESSRSHAFVIVRFAPWSEDDELGGGRRTGPTDTASGTTLVFVDLAGSERVSKTQATGSRLQEGIEINKSLSALGNVMRALAGASLSTTGALPPTIPWRASRLTQVLKSYVCYGSTIWFILCISGEEDHAHESLSTLRFGSAVLGVTLRAHRKEAKDGRESAVIKKVCVSPVARFRDAVSARHWVCVYLCWAFVMVVLGSSGCSKTPRL